MYLKRIIQDLDIQIRETNITYLLKTLICIQKKKSSKYVVPYVTFGQNQFQVVQYRVYHTRHTLGNSRGYSRVLWVFQRVQIVQRHQSERQQGKRVRVRERESEINSVIVQQGCGRGQAIFTFQSIFGERFYFNIG